MLMNESNGKNSFLWRVNTDPPSYFFGTIHVPYTRVWNYIPQNAKMAFRRADTVYFELDLTNPKTISALSSCQLLPKGLHLSQVLPTELFARLTLHLEYVRSEMPSWITSDQIERGINAEYLFTVITGNWERKQPIWVALMINSLTKSDIASRGFPVLDLYLSSLASKQQKSIGAIEKVEEQCRPLSLLNSSQVIFALNHTLIRLEELRHSGYSSDHYTTDDLINSYRTGNLDEVVFSQDAFFPRRLTVPSSSSDRTSSRFNPSERKMAIEIENFVRDKMIHLRNKRMAARVVDLLVNHPGKSYFFAFGAGHFLGNESVLNYVRSAGFKIEHVPPQQSLDTGKFFSTFVPPKRGWKNSFLSSSKTVKGTFDDLSDSEKTRAVLQYLQYYQQLEQVEETKRFQDMLKQRRVSNADDDDDDADEDEDDEDFRRHRQIEEERTVQNSLRIWYGLSNSTSGLYPNSAVKLESFHYSYTSLSLLLLFIVFAIL